MTENTLKTGVKVGKSNKSLIERQRRAKINQRLEEIKELILSFLYQEDPQMYSEKSCVRMDKAEILDFAVEFIKKQKYRQAAHCKFPKHHPIVTSLPWQPLSIHNTLQLPSSKVPLLPRVSPVHFLSENIYSSSRPFSFCGVEGPKVVSPEVGQHKAVPTIKTEAVWRPWS